MAPCLEDDVLSRATLRCRALCACALVALAAVSCSREGGDLRKRRGTFTDRRDGRIYRFVVIGEQTWMAENLDFGSWVSSGVDQSESSPSSAQKYCPDDSLERCRSLGGLYQWHTAMAFPKSCDNYPLGCGAKAKSPHRGICPKGWHVPTNEEWEELRRIAAAATGMDIEEAGRVLKSAIGWRHIVPGLPDGVRVPRKKRLMIGYEHEHRADGTDALGFDGVPVERESCTWWTASRRAVGKRYGILAQSVQMDDRLFELVWPGKFASSLRCVKD